MQEYTVVINGVEHTMQLSEADAKRLAGVAVKAAQTPNKAHAPKNKS